MRLIISVNSLSFKQPSTFKNKEKLKYPSSGPPFIRSKTWAGLRSCLNLRRNFTPWLSPLLELTRTRSGLVHDAEVAFQKPERKVCKWTNMFWKMERLGNISRSQIQVSCWGSWMWWIMDAKGTGISKDRYFRGLILRSKPLETFVRARQHFKC